MKTKCKILIILLIATSAIARIGVPFSDWNWLEENSPDIAIVNCGKRTPNLPPVINGTMSDSEIHSIFVLKGTNAVTMTRLQTDHELRRGEYYLVFGNYNGGINNGIFVADEEYRVVPLGIKYGWELNSLTNSIAGKPLDEQIQILFQRSVNHLNQEIKQDQEEKARLEEGLKK